MSQRDLQAKAPIEINLTRQERVSLCETLDRVLNKGAVVSGGITISVADVELVYLGLQLVLSSAETARAGAGGLGLTIDIRKEPRNGAG